MLTKYNKALPNDADLATARRSNKSVLPGSTGCPQYIIQPSMLPTELY